MTHNNQISPILFGRSLIAFAFCLIIQLNVQAQLVPRYSQYIMNEFLVNPAVAGADALTTYNISGRKEWLGFGANIPTPQSYSASFQTRILKSGHQIKVGTNGRKNRLIKRASGRVGLGASIINDNNGAIQRTGLSATYAYHTFVSRYQLSFGITASIFQLGVRSKYLNFKNNSDEPMLDVVSSSIWTPDFGAGVHFMADKFHVGVSVSQLLESKINFGSAGINASNLSLHLKRNYYLISGYKNEFGNANWEYEPSVFVQMYDPVTLKPQFAGPKVKADVMLRFIYLRSFWLGMAYRTSQEYIVMTGVKYKNLFFTYSFDYGTNGITQYSYGSHEISISAKFGDNTRRYPWMERY